MTREFAPYDRALKLKQIGFDEPCLARWIEKDIRDGGGLKLEIWNDEDTEYEVKSSTKAPTWQSAFRWFREPKNGSLDHLDFMYEYLKDDSMSYEQAELACLDKLIEIATKQQEKWKTVVEFLESVEVDKFARDCIKHRYNSYGENITSETQKLDTIYGFKQGFQKAIELLKQQEK